MKAKRSHTEGRPPAMTATRATQLILLREELEEERLELERYARTLANESARIKGDLLLLAKSNGGTLELSKHRLEVVQADGFFSYKDNLIGEIGFEEFERRRQAVPTKDDLVVTEKHPASSRAVKAAREKVASLRTGRPAAASTKQPSASKKNAA